MISGREDPTGLTCLSPAGSLAERVDDPAAAEDLRAPVHDGALTRRDAALRRPELDPDRVPAGLDHGRDVVAPVADPNLGLEGHRGRRMAGYPRHPIGDRPPAREQLSRSDDHPVGPRVDLQHVRGLGPRDAETAPLSYGEGCRAPVMREHAPLGIDDLA